MRGDKPLLQSYVCPDHRHARRPQGPPLHSGRNQRGRGLRRPHVPPRHAYSTIGRCRRELIDAGERDVASRAIASFRQTKEPISLGIVPPSSALDAPRQWARETGAVLGRAEPMSLAWRCMSVPVRHAACAALPPSALRSRAPSAAQHRSDEARLRSRVETVPVHDVGALGLVDHEIEAFGAA